MADGNSFWYSEGTPENTVIWKVDPVVNVKEEVFDTGRLRDALEAELGHHPPCEGVPFSSFRFVDKQEIAIRFSVEDQEFELRLDNYEIKRLLPESDTDKRRSTPQVIRKAHDDYPDLYEIRSPDGKWFVGAKDHNLYLRSPLDEGITWLTTTGVEDYEWGDLRWVFRVVWSPDSLKLAVLRADYRNVPKIPIVRYLQPMEKVDWVPYPYQSITPIERQELYVIDILSKRPVQIESGKRPYERIECGHWLPDGSEFLFVEDDRYHRRRRLVAASPKSGFIRQILEYPEAPWYPPLWWNFPNALLSDGKHLLWLSPPADQSSTGLSEWEHASQLHGRHHLYLYDIDGTLIRRLTEGAFLVDRVVTVDEANGWVYFVARTDRQRPYDTHLCRVKLDGSGLKQLTQEPGQHDAPSRFKTPGHQTQFSPSKQFFLDSHSSLSRPPRVDLRRADGTLLQTLSKANVDSLQELHWNPPEEFVVKGADGKSNLYGTLYKPHDFDPEKNYPVIHHLHGGEPSTFVSGADRPALAQLGFIVFSVNVRVNPPDGTFGRHEIPEQLAALEHLGETRPYMDLSRVGVMGRSYYGYFAVRSLLMAPETYHVGVAVFPVLDLYTHDNYMRLGPLEENREEYEFSSNYRLAGNLKGKLLLIQGTADYSVPISQTMRMADALVRSDKPFDLLILPEFGHGTNARIQRYWQDRSLEYFVEHLKP
jgi:dipeptidyl aminopeptidase/acylaminoacyl peptidase